MSNVYVYDVSKIHLSHIISQIFKYSHLVCACVTYNLNIYLPMRELLLDMKALNMQNRTVGIIENGSWAPQILKLMKEHFESMK